MSATTTPSRVAIRAALHAAGILTAEGRICSPMLDTPDAAIFALIEREALAQGLFLAAHSRRRKTPADRAEMLRQHAAAREARQRLADTPAATVEGARAKAAAALADINPRRGGGGCMVRLPVSALRDALAGPTAAPLPVVPIAGPKRRRVPRLAALAAAGILTPAGEVAGTAEAGPDVVLFGLLAELEAARDKARPEAPCGAETLPPARMSALAEFLRIEGAVIAMRATTSPGIMAKLRAAVPSGGVGTMSLTRSAILDLLRIGVA